MQGQNRPWRCPDEWQLAAYADSQLAGRALQRVESHLADCRSCLDQVAFLARLRSVEMPAEVPASLLVQARELFAPGQGAAGRPRWLWGTVGAATAGLGVSLALWLSQPSMVIVPPRAPAVAPAETPPAAPPASEPMPLSPPQVRNGQKKTTVLKILLPREGSVVPRDSLEFRWTDIPGSLFYEVKVVTEDGALVWEAHVMGTRASLPSDVRLARGSKYFVWVRAHLPEGRLAKSEIVGFAVASPDQE